MLGHRQVNLRGAAFFINDPIQVNFGYHSFFIIVGMTGLDELRAIVYLVFAEHGVSASADAISVKPY